MFKKLFPTLLAILFLLVLWQIIAVAIGFPAIFPTIPALFLNIFRLIVSDRFYAELGATILRGLAGFGMAFIIAFILASVSNFSEFWKAFFHPVLVVIRSIPVISLVLLALLWFNPSNLPVFIAVLTMLPILYQNILNGFEHVDIRLLEMARVFGKTELEVFYHIYLPGARKIIFAGISTAMGFGWRAVIIGEVLAQPISGIGTDMKLAQTYINVSELMAWTFIAVAVSYIFEFLIKILEKIKLKYISFVKNNPTVCSDNKLVEIQCLSKQFNQKVVFSSFSQRFETPVVYCLNSASGSGKTTFLRIVSGLEKPDKGIVKTDKEYSVAYSFQDVRLLPWLTVFDNIMFGMKISGSQAHQTIVELADNMEVAEHLHKFPHQLSGGQQQRVGLIRALAAQPDVLLLDEPLNGLDNDLKQKTISFLTQWIAHHKVLVIWATHEKISSAYSDIKYINW